MEASEDENKQGTLPCLYVSFQQVVGRRSDMLPQNRDNRQLLPTTDVSLLFIQEKHKFNS